MSSFLVGCRKRTRGCSAVTCVTLSCVGLMLLAAHDPPKEAKSTQEVASAGIEATVQQLAWISGAWDGKGLGGTVEEHWTQPARSLKRTSSTSNICRVVASAASRSSSFVAR
ncbi:MAG: hypothetical protein IID34_03415 [Planctomycetes bacterium]|nr:hypothetical protein [Planctomycetota bacterium]